jgi:methionine-rich copper-binding protein CopC
MKYKFFGLAAASLSLMLAGTSPAFAHAHLVKSNPAINSTVKAMPKMLTLTFTESVEAPFCTVVIENSAGKQIEKGKVQAVSGHPNDIAVPLSIPGEGTFRVIWHALSTDAHKTKGNFTFTVAH